MGGLCSKERGSDAKQSNAGVEYYSVEGGRAGSVYGSNVKGDLTVTELQSYSNGNGDDDFYDGIPRYPSLVKSRSIRSKQGAVAKVSEVSLRLGRAGTVGLGKAVDVLDTLGSSMTNLNPNSGFASTVSTKGNELAILAFEVANTIVKGSNLMQSLSDRSIKHLKEAVLHSEGVQKLISEDMEKLLQLVAADKREELKVFLAEVIRFGNRCRDPQWHNLHRYFDKVSREHTPPKQLKEDAESVMACLMTSVNYTAELYQELQVLDRMEQDFQRNGGNVPQQNGDRLAILKAELKSQKKQVRSLKKKSLWSRSLEEVMDKLVDIVHFLLLEIHHTFGTTDKEATVEEHMSDQITLGPAGLSLHYANVIMQIDYIVARSHTFTQNARNALFQSLPPSVKSSLHSKLRSFHVDEELTVQEIQDEMEKNLHWLVPISANTAKAHHGFGWVGEWANSGSDLNRKTAAGSGDVIRIETLHHANKAKTEACILELVLWLQHLAYKSKICAPLKDGDTNSATDSSISSKPLQKPKHKSVNVLSTLTTEDQEMLHDALLKKTRTIRIRRISKSEDFDYSSKKVKFIKNDRLSKSSDYSSVKESNDSITDLVTVKRLPSAISFAGFGINKERALDIIDRVDVLR